MFSKSRNQMHDFSYKADSGIHKAKDSQSLERKELEMDIATVTVDATKEMVPKH
jgi:hypothetical protein